MLHAVRQFWTALRQADDKTLYLGPDYQGRPLEVVVIADEDADVEVIIHAMLAQARYLPLFKPSRRQEP